LNKPPTDSLRVDADVLRKLIRDVFAAVPVSEEHATLIGELMVDTDLRGVVTHGIIQVKRYYSDFRSGATNTHPDVRVLREAAGTVALTGDGGLGYIAGHKAMAMAIDKARKTGIGAATTTYHEHIGSAGKYARMAMRQNMIGFCFSGRSPRRFDPAAMVNSSADSAPMAFGIPAGPDHPDLLVDSCSNITFDEDFFAKYPEIYFRCIGYSHMANIMSGTLGGQMLEVDPETVRYPTANQSGFYLALSVEHFVPVEDFKDDMDGIMDSVSRMEPYPGFEAARLPGGPEFDRERAYRRDGVPVCGQAKRNIEQIAGELGVDLPW